MSLASQPHWSDRQPSHNINSFGAFLRYLRESVPISQKDLTAAFPQYFEEYRTFQFLLSGDMYRKMEKGRAAQYEELLPLFASLIGCGCKPSLQDCRIYVGLARQKLESLRTRRPKLRSDGEWRMLETHLFQLARSAGAKEESEPHLKERLRIRQQAFDISHLVGREEWLATMLSHAENQKKLVVISGMMGVGKTSGLKLLLSHFLNQPEACHPLFSTFPSASDMKPADHLQTLLATILAELDASEPEATKTVSLETQVKQVLTRIAQLDQRVVLLLDDAQHILNERGRLTPEWEYFLATYLEVDHQALIYLAAREWPFWTGRNHSFLVDGEAAVLPDLDEQACLKIWEKMGFGDVSEALLAQATRKCGSNPLMIELRAASMVRPRFPYGWGNQRKKAEAGSSAKSEHHLLVEHLLEDAEVFSTFDVEATALLQQVISQRLSHEALELLDVLATSPLALPFPVLAEIYGTAEYAFFMEVENASLLDRTTMNADGRASLQPLAREAGRQKLLAEKRLKGVEEQVAHLYKVWLEEGIFQDEQEQAALVSELTIIYLKQHRLFEAASVLIEYGWLSLAFGHASRLARIADNILRSYNWRQSIEDEFGGQLLYYYLVVRFLEKSLDAPERKRAYLRLYDFMSSGNGPLHFPVLVHLAVHKLRYLTTDKQYQEAYSLIEGLCARYQNLQEAKPASYAELLDRRAFVLGRWGDFQDAQAKQERAQEVIEHLLQESLCHRQEAILVHQHCLMILREQENFASPIEQSRIRFKRARLLHDLSYYQRCTDHFEEAKLAMEECLRLKEAGYVVPGSLAVSYDDYGQLLSQLGHYQDAQLYSERALQMTEE